MKDCTKCKYAEWDRTVAGKLHPAGTGKCTYPYKVPKLPESMYWLRGAPIPSGGYILRKEWLEDDCVYYSRKREGK